MCEIPCQALLLELVSLFWHTNNDVLKATFEIMQTIARLCAFQLENTLGSSYETGVTLGIDS